MALVFLKKCSEFPLWWLRQAGRSPKEGSCAAVFVFPSGGIFENINLLTICGPGGYSVPLEEAVGLCFVLSLFQQVKNPVKIKVKERNPPRLGLLGPGGTG